MLGLVRTLVTGGAGFIGTHLVERLLAQGDDVVVLDSLEPQVHGSDAPSLPDAVELIEGDVGDDASVERALAGVERVVHLAAAVGVGQSMYEIARYVRQNTMATAPFLERVVAQATRPRRLVVASSMSIYGEGEYVCERARRVAPGPRPEEQLARTMGVSTARLRRGAYARSATRESKPLIPTSVYAITKRDHEELCLVTGAAYGIPTVALRFFNVYGPGQALSNPYTGVAAIFASRLLNGNAPVIFEDGRQSRDFIHVSDIVEGILARLESEDAVGHAVNLGTGAPAASTTSPTPSRTASGSTIEPSGPISIAPATSVIATPTPTLAERLLGFKARVALRRRHGGVSSGCGARKPSIASRQRRSELDGAGLAPM